MYRLLALVPLLALLACREPKPRVYSEVAFKELAPAARGPMGMGAMAPVNASPVDIKVTWTLPDTWVKKDSAMGMRVGSFLAPDPELALTGEADPLAADVSVTQLAGDGGGLKANISRWMNQVGIIHTVESMEEFVKSAERFKTKTGQEGLFVDMTEMLSGDMTQTRTIFGGIVATEDYTVFVKAMGDQGRVKANKGQLKAFCKSLSIVPGPGT